MRWLVPIGTALALLAIFTLRDVETASLLESTVQLKPGAEVTLLTTAWCGYCRAGRAFLTRNEVPFTEFDVEHSPEGAALYRELGAPGVPILIVDEEIQFGMDLRAWIDALEG